MIDKLLEAKNNKASTVKPSSKQIQMGSLAESTPVKDFNSAIQDYLEKCPPETDWFKRGSELYAITTDNTLKLAEQFGKLKEAINSWPKTTDMTLEKLIIQLSTNIFDYYDSQTKLQSEPSTPERKNSLDSNSDSEVTSVGSSLSSSPEDAASISAEPTDKQEIIDYKSAIAKFKKACVKHSPDWLPKALALYDVLSNENLIDDASKFDALIKKIDAWGKVNNPELAIAITQLESDLKAYYEAKRPFKPYLHRTNSSGSDLSESSTLSSSSSSSSPDKSSKSKRKPRNTRMIDLNGTNNGDATKTSIKTNTVQTITTSAQSSAAAASSSPTELQIEAPTTVQARPGTPVSFTTELPFDMDKEQKSGEFTDISGRSASPSSDATASASSGSAISSPSLTPPKSSPNISPTREQRDQSAVVGSPQTPRVRAAIPEQQEPATTPAHAEPARSTTPEQKAPVTNSTHEEPARSTTPQRRPSPALETISAVAAATPVVNIINNTKHAPENKSPAEEMRSNREQLMNEIKSLEQAIDKAKKEINQLELKINEGKQQRETHKRDLLDPRLKKAITNVDQQIEKTEASFGNRSAKRWWDYIPLVKSIPAIKNAYANRQAKLDKQFQTFQSKNQDLYEAKALLADTQKSLINPEALKEYLTKLEKSSNPATEHGTEVCVIYNRVSELLKSQEYITNLENDLARCKRTKSNNDNLLTNKQLELRVMDLNQSVKYTNNASKEPLTPTV